jgi:hypothetical protein
MTGWGDDGPAGQGEPSPYQAVVPADDDAGLPSVEEPAANHVQDLGDDAHTAS